MAETVDINPPVGANKRFLIKFNGTPHAGADTWDDAVRMIEYYRKMPKGRVSTTASKGNWEIEDRNKPKLPGISILATNNTGLETLS